MRVPPYYAQITEKGSGTEIAYVGRAKVLQYPVDKILFECEKTDINEYYRRLKTGESLADVSLWKGMSGAPIIPPINSILNFKNSLFHLTGKMMNKHRVSPEQCFNNGNTYIATAHPNNLRRKAV